jgi:hypothetical protein
VSTTTSPATAATVAAGPTRRRETLEALEARIRTVDTLLRRRWPGGEVRRGGALLYLSGASPSWMSSRTLVHTMKPNMRGVQIDEETVTPGLRGHKEH